MSPGKCLGEWAQDRARQFRCTSFQIYYSLNDGRFGVNVAATFSTCILGLQVSIVGRGTGWYTEMPSTVRIVLLHESSLWLQEKWDSWRQYVRRLSWRPASQPQESAVTIALDSGHTHLTQGSVRLLFIPEVSSPNLDRSPATSSYFPSPAYNLQ